MNYVAVKTLTLKELKRFIRVPFQTVGQPIVTALLYFLVFATAIGSRIGAIDRLSYVEFIMPGLIMMNVLTTAFFGISSGLMLSKMMNTLSDLLVSPMSYLEIVIGYTLSSVIRSFFIGMLIYATALFFVPFRMDHAVYLIAFTVLVIAAFSLAGLIVGIWADNFEQVSLFPTFLITPLTFLGGVFYSVTMLPPVLRTLSHYNPFFYLISGMRYGFYSVADVAPSVSLSVVAVMVLVFGAVTWHLFRIGYKIRN